MRYSLSVLFLFSACYLHVTAQKPPLDTSAFRKWAGVGEGKLSSDGNYVSYQIYNQPAGSSLLVIQSTQNKWKKEFPGASMTVFSNDNNQAIFKTSNDSLWILTLGNDDLRCLVGVGEFALFDKDSGNNWLVYRMVKERTTLVLHNLSDSKELLFPSVLDYQFFHNGSCLLMATEQKNDSGRQYGLVWMDLSRGTKYSIWSGIGDGAKPGAWALSADDSQLAFLVENKKNDLSTYELWHYQQGISPAQRLMEDHSPDISEGMQIDGQAPVFSQDGSEIYFELRKKETMKTEPDAIKMDIWSYIDTMLYPLQVEDTKQVSTYLSVINIATHKVIVLEGYVESVVGKNDNFALLREAPKNYYSPFESYWNRAAQSTYWLVSTRDGSRKLLKDHLVNDQEGLAMSPGGKWILYYDRKKKNYFSYEIATKITRNITYGVPVSWLNESNDRLGLNLNWVPWQQTWLLNDEAVLIYDNWDIWQVDPSGKRLPIDITNGYGRKNQIQFRLALEGSTIRDLSMEKKSRLLLTAFNGKTKDRGFYSKTLGLLGNPVLSIMGPYIFGDWGGYDTYNSPPIKAKNSNSYLLKRMSAQEAPNYLVTHDLVRFTPLTDVQPQKEYNWLRTELIHWKTLDGSFSDGILYKPENFDPKKKYPILFDFYERRSEELNFYIGPENGGNRINIPWYVSHGYLVCAPDIHYKRGQPGKSACNSIVSAALHLSKIPWVDNKRMGIQGHSFGGYETNYIVTHTKLFAAACSASGFVDLIGWYSATTRGSYGKYWSEHEQGRMGATLWKIPKKYIEESPIFRADRVSAPLLLMANKGDEVVPFSQGVEFFTALRRLGKRVWMLQYDDGNHSVGDEDAADYSHRMWQFFDHYLKGAPAPIWMTKGIPARLRGIEKGFEPDREIKTPGHGLNLDSSAEP